MFFCGRMSFFEGVCVCYARLSVPGPMLRGSAIFISNDIILSSRQVLVLPGLLRFSVPFCPPPPLSFFFFSFLECFHFVDFGCFYLVDDDHDCDSQVSASVQYDNLSNHQCSSDDGSRSLWRQATTDQANRPASLCTLSECQGRTRD